MSLHIAFRLHARRFPRAKDESDTRAPRQSTVLIACAVISLLAEADLAGGLGG